MKEVQMYFAEYIVSIFMEYIFAKSHITKNVYVALTQTIEDQDQYDSEHEGYHFLTEHDLYILSRSHE